tara:strand:+ start:27 stop:260 length:234 start_codon:yes stop_codon:yes gene_type:complete
MAEIRRLDKSEKEFVKDTCGFYKDMRIAEELTRIRRGLNIKETVTIDQVRKARYRMGLSKQSGRGVCRLREKDDDDK